MEKIIKCYGCRDYEMNVFQELGQKYNCELICDSKYLTDDNYEDAIGYEIIMIRGNCNLSDFSLKKLKDHGLQLILTRTVGYDHLDLNACKKYGIEVANVPNYSPYAVSELVITFAMMLLRNVAYAVNRTSNYDFTVTNQMFSKEIRNSTVGIIGCGKIGRCVAKQFKGLGAKVIGYDLYPNAEGTEYIEYESLEEVIKNSDIITIHMAYIKGINDNFINKELISKMKKECILINTSRGETLDLDSAVEAIKNNQLGGLAIDVIKDERKLFFQKWDQNSLSPRYQELINLYPKVLITPHIGSSTDMALYDMIDISLQNMLEYINNRKCKNSLITKE